MNRTETAKVLSILRATYPRFYMGMSRQDMEDILNLWESLFDEPFEVVANAVKALISTDTKGFPPVPGQVKAKIRKLTHPHEMTPVEAWGYVSKALKNCTYGSREEFAKLPEVLQGVIGDPELLRDWAQMPPETVQSVIASKFESSYQGRIENVREWQAIPEDVKEFHRQIAETITKPMPELPETDETKLIAMRDDKIERAKKAFEVQALLEEAIVKDVTKIPNPWAMKEPTEEEKKDFEARKKEMMDKLKGMKD